MPFIVYFHFQRDREESPKAVVREDGNTDYYNLNLIENVVAGQILASVHEVEEETEDPFLENIEGPEFLPRYIGENVELDEEIPIQIVAKANGQVIYENGIISVSTVYETKGDVDFSTGNLTFVGHLSVKGSVRNDFSVLANDVTVYGNVDDSHIRSGNRVLVQGDILGAKSSIIAGSSVSAKFIENASVSAKGNIFIGLSFLSGNIKSGGSVIIRDPGILHGGKIYCKNSLYAKKIGTNWSNPTEIRLGDDPFLLDRLEEVRKMVQTLQHREAELEKGVIPGNTKDSSNTELLRAERERTKVSLLRFKLFEKQLQKRLEDQRKENRNIGLYAIDQVKPGTKINIFDAKLFVKETMEQVYFYYDNGEIKIGECRQSMESLLRS